MPFINMRGKIIAITQPGFTCLITQTKLKISIRFFLKLKWLKIERTFSTKGIKEGRKREALHGVAFGLVHEQNS